MITRWNEHFLKKKIRQQNKAIISENSENLPSSRVEESISKRFRIYPSQPINNRVISTTDKFQKFSRKSSDHLARRLSWGSLEWAQPSPTPRKFMNEETAWIAARSIGFLGRVSTVERQNEPFGDIRTSVGDARFSSTDRKRDFETGSKRIRRPRGTSSSSSTQRWNCSSPLVRYGKRSMDPFVTPPPSPFYPPIPVKDGPISSVRNSSRA